MPKIASHNPDFPRNQFPTTTPHYLHGLEARKSFIPLAFQVVSPFDYRVALLPHALVMHINPSTLSEQHSKKIERVQTLGGWVEFHWGDNLSDISADGSTGSFLNIQTGLSSFNPRETIAHSRFRDLSDLYHHDGSVYDPYGNIVLQGNIMLMYDRGIYIGSFRNFSFEISDAAPYNLTYSWTFKVEHTIMSIPGSFRTSGYQTPTFQSQNTLA